MSLEHYWRKRDFAKTPEPAGALGGSVGAARFVVQRHRATRLHYDFRLEIDGVLVSWAVPRGPSMRPLERRMAARTEDHPVEYLDFEGVIPKGEYGGGDVIVWDIGTWEPEGGTARPHGAGETGGPHGAGETGGTSKTGETPGSGEASDAARAIASGELKFVLHGERLRGRFVIVRTSGRKGTLDAETGQDQWLLMHKRDTDADPTWDIDQFPTSVLSGRTNDQVKEGVPALWDSSKPAAEARIDLSAAVDAPLPTFVPPMLATAVDGPFSDPDWLFEMKLDGYRVEAVVDRGTVRLWTRNRQDAARYFPELAAGTADWLLATSAVVDGEVVALGPDGNADFSLLQDRTGLKGLGVHRGDRRASDAAEPERTPAPLVFQLFDLLYLDGRSLLGVPLDDRKRLLRRVVRNTQRVRYLAHIDSDGEDLYDAAEAHGVEGIIAKLRRSTYDPGKRSRAWLKIEDPAGAGAGRGRFRDRQGNARGPGRAARGHVRGWRVSVRGRGGQWHRHPDPARTPGAAR